MKCADPVLCYLDSKGNRRFRNFSFAIKQIGGIPNSHIVFDCGKCLFCRKKKAYELACRCVLHSSLYLENCFLTLTYDESLNEYHNEFQYEDIQKFKKRLRQHCKNKKIEIFNVHEYGKNGKKHWHLIVFNHDFKDKIIHSVKNDLPLYTSAILESLWPFGFNTIGDVSGASAMYTAQYTQKDFQHGNYANKRKSHSKHSGIGKPYFLKHYEQILLLGYIPINGMKMPIPRYFQKLADRHYSHFYEPSKFFDTPVRKAIHRPFSTKEEPNKKLADLYVGFKEQREAKIIELSDEWLNVVAQYLTTNDTPDFIKSHENFKHDLNNKPQKEKF